MSDTTTLNAARLDLWLTAHRLHDVTNWMRQQTNAAGAPFWLVHTLYLQRAIKGDHTAARKLRELDEAATAFEGARVALAELNNQEATA